MAKVLRQPAANEDLYEIWSYVAHESFERAEALIDRFDEAFELLATQPEMGRARPELAPSLRSFPLGNYTIFYVPLEDGIEVVRVLHGARDIPGLFGS